MKQVHIVRLVYFNAVVFLSRFMRFNMTNNVHEPVKEQEIEVRRYPLPSTRLHPAQPNPSKTSPAPDNLPKC